MMDRAALVQRLERLAPGAMHFARRIRSAARRRLSKDPAIANRRPRLDSEPWFLDRLAVEAGMLEVRGWAFPPVGWFGVAPPRFAVNGKPLAPLAREARPDVGEKFWQREHAAEGGFTGRVPMTHADAYPGGMLEIAYLNPPAKLPLSLRHRWFALDPALEPALPSARQRHRVIGNEDPAGFLLTGATDFHRLDRALLAATGRSFGDCACILDWGVGCGRLARYATRLCPETFTGCDVDADNIAWCAKALPGRYVHTSMFPPLPFADGAFDAVYGVSVFTHLREELQDRWLEELRRIVRPGGVVLATVHGRTAIEYAGLRPEAFVDLGNAVEKAGLFVASDNDQLDGAVEHAREYVNVFHSSRYVRERWSRAFEVRQIVPGYIFTHDLVILVRR